MPEVEHIIHSLPLYPPRSYKVSEITLQLHATVNTSLMHNVILSFVHSMLPCWSHTHLSVFAPHYVHVLSTVHTLSMDDTVHMYQCLTYMYDSSVCVWAEWSVSRQSTNQCLTYMYDNCAFDQPWRPWLPDGCLVTALCYLARHNIWACLSV